MELSHVNFNKSVDAVFLDNKLRGLQWITPKFSENPKYELELLRQTKNVIERDTNNKIIITNYLMLPAITNNKNYAPNKWFDDLSVPKKNNVYFKFYQDFFLESLKKQKIKNIYIIGGKRKTTSLLNTIKNKDCIFTQSINEITKKISIKNCLNEK